MGSVDRDPEWSLHRLLGPGVWFLGFLIEFLGNYVWHCICTVLWMVECNAMRLRSDMSVESEVDRQTVD